MVGYPTYTAAAKTRAQVLNAFMRGVYQWMAFGMLVTAGAAFMVANSVSMQQAIFGNPILFYGLIIGELVMVFGLSLGIRKLSAAAASGIFLAYSALNGLTLSVVLLAYTASSVTQTFVVCSVMFGAMSLYGLTTKKDLTSWGSFLFMGLIGIVIAMVVNIFLRSTAMQFVISFIGVIVFTGLTAYDTQKLMLMGESVPHDDATAVRRGVILGALTLYLDFVNLFLMLLQFFGVRRD